MNKNINYLFLLCLFSFLKLESCSPDTKNENKLTARNLARLESSELLTQRRSTPIDKTRLEELGLILKNLTQEEKNIVKKYIHTFLKDAAEGREYINEHLRTEHSTRSTSSDRNENFDEFDADEIAERDEILRDSSLDNPLKFKREEKASMFNERTQASSVTYPLIYDSKKDLIFERGEEASVFSECVQTLSFACFLIYYSIKKAIFS